MATEILITTECEAWYDRLSIDEQASVDHYVELPIKYGPNLGFPYSSGISGSSFSSMRELRIQHAGRPYRVLYAFDPKRQAILLIGGEKTGKERWYEDAIKTADRLFDKHLRGV